jgi:hypothetical protein
VVIFIEKAIVAMVLLRLLSGSIEIFAAYMMFKFNDVEKALIINSSLALIGPVILLITTAVGLSSIADKVPFGKILCIFFGVGLIIYGVLSD